MVVSREGAQVVLGTAMAGELYPFIISFPAPPHLPRGAQSRYARDQQQQQQKKQQKKKSLRRKPPSRRNTEDFMFTGVLDSGPGTAGSNGAPT
ncbi:unnamed protein product, partial [Laminaria digitata]